MPSFTQAQTVAVGDELKASQLASLAAAFNTRLMSGVGDMVWRVAYYLHSGLFRQLRNSDGASTFPPDAEFWNIYQHINPNDAQYPLTGPGDPEGANLSNIVNSFVYGGEAVGLDPEIVRLGNIPTSYSDGLPMTPSRYWALGQFQRGAYDPTTGAASWPVGDAAKAYAYIRQSIESPHGNAWGGWLPYPEDAGGCADAADANLQILFTNLNDASTKSYTTNCPEDGGAVSIAYSPFAYIVFHASGAIEILAKSEWIEGPYESTAQWSKTQANALARVLNHYSSEFRGTAEQGGGTTNYNAFDLQRFLTTQYPLAPNVGHQVGDYLTAMYPAWKSFETQSDGSALSYVTGGTSHTWAAGTVCTGFLIKSALLDAPVEIQIEENGTIIKRVTLPEGEYEELFWLPVARPLTAVKVRINDELNAGSGGGIYLEATELLEMNPQLHDYYLVTRLSFYGFSYDRIDGRGIDCNESVGILTNLYSYGAITPAIEADGLVTAGTDPVLNQNAVYDAARRLSKYVRIIPRWQLTGYAIEDGKSVLWFNRTAYGPAGYPDRDAFEDIGPSQEEIVNTPIKWGRLYVVTEDTILYNEHSYALGERFVGVEGLTSYTGGGKCKEYQGIKQNAEPNDYSNAWAMTLTLKPYNESPSSIWKTDAYGDILSPFLNRCHIDSPEIDASKRASIHESFGQGSLFPEAPSGYNYGRMRDCTIPGQTHINKLNCGGDPVCDARKLAFYKSCRIYEPPLEVESAVMDGADLKLTLNGRLQNHASAASSIDRDISTWNLVTLRTTEDYRTHENGIREYLVWQGTGTNASVKIGDNALNSSGPGGSDNPYGSCLPTFVFCKLIPTPYLDENDTLESNDSYATHDQLKQAELYLRASCEGFVDGYTSAEVACRTFGVAVYDYTYENLMYQACGNRWIPLLPETQRPDNPFGFGPLPNTEFYASTFNALSAGVNLLTDARIMLPSEGQYRLITGTATGSISGRDACNDPQDCSGMSSGTFVHGTAALDAAATSASGWGGGFIGGAANFGTNLVGSTSGAANCTDNRWNIVSTRTTMEIRWVLTDPDSYWALPGNLDDLLDTNSVAAMALSSSTDSSVIRYGTLVDAGGNASGLCGSDYAYFEVSNSSVVTCGGMRGTITAPFLSGLVGIGYESAFVISTTGPSVAVVPDVFEDGTAIVRIPTGEYLGGS